MFKRRSKNENNKHIFQFHGLKSDNKSTRVYFQRIFTQFSIYFFYTHVLEEDEIAMHYQDFI